MGMTMEAQEAKRSYQREYRHRNRDRINAQQRKWNARNPDKIREYQKCYWERQAGKRNIRASWEDYGISKERYLELQEVVRSGRYDAVVRSTAYAANKDIAEYILLSVVKNKSYDALKIKWELKEIEQMPCCRTDFYGIRRLFFHYLDCALKEQQEIL